MGDQAREKDDLIRAVVEYSAALKLKSDSSVDDKLLKTRKILEQREKAALKNSTSPTQKEILGIPDLRVPR